MKKCILVAFLCAMAYAQFLDDKFVVLPKFELKSQMTAKVKHFVENAKQQQGFVRKTNVKRDLLGRKTEDSTSYLVDYAKEERMKVVVSYINQPSPFSGKLYGRYESGFSADEKKYWLNGIEMDEMSYLSKHDEIRKSIRRSIPQYRQPYVAFLTAKEIQQLLAGPEFVYVSEYMDRIPLSNDTTVNGRVYYRDSIIRVLSQIQTGAFQNGYKGNGIGIYFSEAGCPNLNYVNASYYVQVDSCFRGVRTHPTRVTRVLQTTAPQATVYGFEEGTSRPANPLNYPIPIYIGSHSWGIPPSSADSVSSYTYEDIAMDNYVYNDRVILFIAAGNKMSSTDTYYISSPGKSVNSITVGAVEPNTYNYAAYSCWKNSELQNHKPEIPNFAHFYFMGDTPFSVMEDGVLKTYNGVFSGTSASTPYTAAMAADVLSQHSFFKTHPEMFKALMMTGSTVPVADANSKDLDNYIRIKKNSSIQHDGVEYKICLLERK